MSKNSLIVPDLDPMAGAAHAVVAEGVLYTSVLGPVDRHGEVIGDELRVQAEQVYANLGALLQWAGARWAEVVKVYTYVAPQAVTPAGRLDLHAVEGRYLGGDQAGVAVGLPLPEPGWLVAVEAVAHPGTPKSIVADVSDAQSASGWAQAVRVGPSVYVGAQIVDGMKLADGDAKETGRSRVRVETRAVYEALGSVLQRAGASWGDVLKVHQYATRGDIAFDEIRGGREPFLRTGEFISTSVVGSARHPRWPVDRWLLQVDAEAYVGPKRFIRVPGVWANPGGLQATEAGGILFMQAQMSRDSGGRTLHPDDPLAHAERVFQNLDGVLREIGVDWSEVVHARTFCRGPEDLAAVRRIRGQWLAPGQHAMTDLLAGFFDREARVEIELLAVARSSP